MAHARGLRVSGHVPAFMRAREFIEAGADEIQHLNFIVLNFFPDVKDTRSKDRYTITAEKLQRSTSTRPQFADFMALLQQHHTVLDPTLSVFQDLYSGAPGAARTACAPMIAALPAGHAAPPAVRRGGGAGRQGGRRTRRRCPALQRLLKRCTTAA